MSEPTPCPRCQMVSHHPKDIEHSWCANCKLFTWAMEDQNPVPLNAVLGELEAVHRYSIGMGEGFSLSFEQYSETGLNYRPWRAYLKVGRQIISSKRHHRAPTDALHELYMVRSTDSKGMMPWPTTPA